MPPVSLLATAAQLGKTSGQVFLSKLRENGYSRTHATSGYLRVNPFEIEDGRGDDPSRADSKHFLSNWLGYLQANMHTGSQLLVSSSYGEVNMSWTKPSGYDRAPGILDQVMYIKGTGETEINEVSTSVNPFDTPFKTTSAGDNASGTISANSLGGEIVAVGVKVEFDDSVTVRTNADSVAYSIAAGQDPLIGAGRGIAVKIFALEPTIDGIEQIPADPSTCQAGSDITLRIRVVMEGTSTGRLEESVNGGAFLVIDAGVQAGTVGDIDLIRTSGNNYRYRLRYNDVSPDSWATSVNFSLECTLP